MNFHNLAKSIAPVILTYDGTNYKMAAGVDGSVVNSTEVDMLGWDGVLFCTLVEAVAANGVLTTTIQNSATSATYGAGTVDQVGSSKTNSAGGAGDNLPHVHDVYKPLYRYLRQRSQRTVGNVTILALVAIKYNGQAPTPAAVYDMLQTLNSPAPSLT